MGKRTEDRAQEEEPRGGGLENQERVGSRAHEDGAGRGLLSSSVGGAPRRDHLVVAAGTPLL